jgi:hypothetical protein
VNNTNLRMTILFLFVLCIGLYFYTDSQKKYYDRTAKPIATELLVAISDWQQDTLVNYLSTETRQAINEEQIGRMILHYQQFGPLNSIDDLQFSRIASALSLVGPIRINYQSDASYQSGRAHINITLTYNNDQLKIYNLSITPIH